MPYTRTLESIILLSARGVSVPGGATDVTAPRATHMRRGYRSRQFSGSCSRTKRSWLIRTNTGTRNYLLLEHIPCTYVPTIYCIYVCAAVGSGPRTPPRCTRRPRDVTFSARRRRVSHGAVLTTVYHPGGIRAARQRRCLCLMSETRAMFMAKLMARTRGGSDGNAMGLLSTHRTPSPPPLPPLP